MFIFEPKNERNALTGSGNNSSNGRGMNLLRFGFVRQQFHDFFQNQICKYVETDWMSKLIGKGCENLKEHCYASSTFLKKCQQIFVRLSEQYCVWVSVSFILIRNEKKLAFTELSIFDYLVHFSITMIRQWYVSFIGWLLIFQH